MDAGLLILRIVVGGLFAMHGAQKLFGWFGGHGLEGTGGFFEQLRFRNGRLSAALAGLSELGGGLALTAGFVTPLAAAVIVGVMTVAIVTVKLQQGLFGGYELDLLYAVPAVALAFAGPGAYSVDEALGWNLAGWTYGVAALGLGLIAATAQLASRRPVPAAVPEAQLRQAA